MKLFHLDDMTGGWFVGNFEPTAFKSLKAEVCYIKHAKGERPRPHYHLIAPEITLVLRGKVQINEHIFTEGDIFVVEPGESVAPYLLEDTEVVVVKIPSVPGDKYFDDPDST
jgi:quercetin dioxygenase-like cupin family protein